MDTNVLVHLARGDDAGVRIDRDHRLRDNPERPIISIITVGEVESLVLKWRWGSERRSALRELLRNLIVVDLSIPGVVGKYAEIGHFSEQELKPARRRGQNDMWIAATAAALDALLITSDNDFDHLHEIKLQRVKVDPRSGATLA